MGVAAVPFLSARNGEIMPFNQPDGGAFALYLVGTALLSTVKYEANYLNCRSISWTHSSIATDQLQLIFTHNPWQPHPERP